MQQHASSRRHVVLAALCLCHVIFAVPNPPIKSHGMGISPLAAMASLGRDLGDPTAPQHVHVTTNDGTLVGTSFGGVPISPSPRGQDRFLGVPYAKPPVGDLRWRRPVPADSWQGLRNATSYAADCVSGLFDYVHRNQSEDCLYLNIFRPSYPDTPNISLPVMVYLYGGTWEAGGSSFFGYDGGNLAKAGQAIIVVPNYRLVAFGFLAAPELAAEDPEGSTGNYGLLDQRLALQWVADNIAAFGGDPQNVMLYGQSAGAGSTTIHAVMPKSNGLFKKIGLESGPPTDWITLSLNYSYSHADLIASALGCDARNGNRLACLRSATFEDIVQNLNDDPSRTVNWAPVIDGVELLDDPQQLWQSGQFNNFESVMLGTVANEGTEFLTAIAWNATPADYDDWLSYREKGPLRDRVAQMYPAGLMPTPFLTAAKIVTDAQMACAARRGAGWAHKYNKTVYLYEFVHQPLVMKTLVPIWYVGHCSDVPFIFHTDDLLFDGAEMDLSSAIVAYWTNFAATSDPSVKGSTNPNGHNIDEAWLQFSPTVDNYLQLNLSSTMADSYDAGTYCDGLWDVIYAQGCDIRTWPLELSANHPAIAQLMSSTLLFVDDITHAPSAPDLLWILNIKSDLSSPDFRLTHGKCLFFCSTG